MANYQQKEHNNNNTILNGNSRRRKFYFTTCAKCKCEIMSMQKRKVLYCGECSVRRFIPTNENENYADYDEPRI